MNNGITAFTVHEEDLHHHISLYRLIPELALDEDGVTSLLSDEDLMDRLAKLGYRHVVTIPNDRRLADRVKSGSDYLAELCSESNWTGAIVQKDAMFFFDKPADATAFELTA